MTRILVFISLSFVFCGALSYLGSRESHRHAPTLDHVGELQQPCFPDGECLGSLKCRLHSGIASDYYSCVP